MPDAALFARTVFARAYPRLMVTVRERWWAFFDVFLPLVAVSAYVLVYRTIGAPADYIGFVIVGGAMSAFWANVLWAMANQLFWERESGNLALYIMSPTSMMAILLGMAAGGIIATSVRAAAILAIGTLMFHVRYDVTHIPLLMLVFVLALIALYGMGMMFASLFLVLGREGWHIVNFVQEPVTMVSGTYFPITGFNTWVAAAASLVPLTLALDALRQLTFTSGPAVGFLNPRIEAAALALMGMVFVYAAQRSLAFMEEQAVRNGRLTESRG